MRRWDKYLLVDADEDVSQKIDGSPDEHRRGIGGYDTSAGYGSKEDFFKLYYDGGPPRYKIYHEFLKKHIKKDGTGLSIASGRCVNELKLSEEGFNVLCTDLENYCGPATQKIFKNFYFETHNILQLPFSRPADYAMCFSLFYLFDEREMQKVFDNIYKSLKPGGVFILDPGGAQNNFATAVLDNILCPADVCCHLVARRLIKGERKKAVKKHQGYRNTSDEIINAARQAGFQLKDVQMADPLTELKGRLVSFKIVPDCVTGFLGRGMPYVRLFCFSR